jgi:protein tyrosine phosphatase
VGRSHRRHREGFVKTFSYRLAAATFYRISVDAEFIVASRVISKTYALVLSTAPPAPVAPFPPDVAHMGDGKLRVRRRTTVERQPVKRSSIGNFESSILVIVERNSTIPSILETTVARGLGKAIDSRSIGSSNEILMNVTNALLFSSPYYVAGIMDVDEIEFIVGEDKTRLRSFYQNPPLKHGQEYLVWLAAENRIDGIMLRAYSRASEPVYVTTHVNDGSLGWWWWLLIIILIIVTIFLLVICAMFVNRLWHRSRSERHLAGDKAQKNTASSTCRMSFPLAMASAAALSHLEARAAAASDRRKPSNVSESYMPVTPVGEHSFAEPRLVYETNPSSTNIKRTNPIDVKKLRPYCEHYLRANLNSALNKEFACLPKSFTSSVSVAIRQMNAAMNRTSESVPYDRNRIRLNSGDYINASLVQTIGWRKFVVTQFPTPATFSRFWAVIWERNISTIVALAEPDDTDCKIYWPEPDGVTVCFDDFSVKTVRVDALAHYTVREFLVERKGFAREHRHLVQWQYTWWPSTGGDATCARHPVDFLNFVKTVRSRRVRSRRRFVANDVLVHCVTGGGRSGLFLAIDALIDQGQYTGMVDVLKCVSLLRTERCTLVRSQRQYHFLYQCLCEEFDHPKSWFDVGSFLSIVNLSSTTDAEYSHIFAPFYFASARCNHVTADQLNKRCSVNRHSSAAALTPRKSFGECLRCTAATDSDDNDCNRFDPDHYPAVNADGFIDRCTFVVHQCPNSFEADSFWNAVVDNKVSCVVALCSIAADVSNHELIVPLFNGETAKVARYVITCHSARLQPDVGIKIYSLSVSTRQNDGNEQVEAVRAVHVYELVCWPSKVTVPLSSSLVQLVNQVMSLVFSQLFAGLTIYYCCLLFFYCTKYKYCRDCFPRAIWRDVGFVAEEDISFALWT